MGFFDRIRKALSSGEPEVAGGDPEAQAILSEEYGAGDPDVPLERPTHFMGDQLDDVGEAADRPTDQDP